MTYKSVLVHIDNAQVCRRRIDLAATFARQHEAHLIGLYWVPNPMTPVALEAGLTTEILQAIMDESEQRLASAEQLFTEALNSAVIQSEWRVVDDPLPGQLALHARHGDLVIAGQHDPSDAQSTANAIIVQMTLASGRPTLMIPYIGTEQDEIGKRIMVAWNGSREAVRAVHDALPLLRAAQNVEVIAINPDSGQDEIACADICVHLARHGVHVEARESRTKGINVGGEILTRAADGAADLIVMGAYGRSRMRELVFGGATREVLAHMTVPVFMSH